MREAGFDYHVLLLPVLFFGVGWPGLLIGGLLGAVLWRRHRWRGAVIGAVLTGMTWAVLVLGPLNDMQD